MSARVDLEDLVSGNAARDELAAHISESVDVDWITGDATYLAHSLLNAGYRKIFDGDCGLSNVKDPDDHEAAEAWMRWANLAMNEDVGAIYAMKKMLTELGYRKAQP